MLESISILCLALSLLAGPPGESGGPSLQVARIPTRFHSRMLRKARLPAKDKVVCLTFDDGPAPGTAQVLRILKENRARATFFLVGRNVKRYPELARRIALGGHAIGNHSFSHAKSLTSQKAEAELEWTNRLIERATGAAPSLFRPPYGLKTSALTVAARRRKLPVVLWSVSSADTAGIDSKTIANNILHTPWPGDIILMHDGGGNHASTIKALPTVIKGIRNLGYRMITVPEMLELWEKEAQASDKDRRPGTGTTRATSSLVR